MAFTHRRLAFLCGFSLLASVAAIMHSASAAWPTASSAPAPTGPLGSLAPSSQSWALPPAKPVANPLGKGSFLVSDAGLISTMPHDAAVAEAVFSPDGKRLATACGDGTAHVWDISTGKELAVCKGHLAAIYRVIFTPDGKQIITGSADKTARLWDAATGKLIRTFAKHQNHVHDIAYDAASNTLLTASCDGSFMTWDLTSGQVKATKQTGGSNESCAFAPDGKSLFVATAPSSAAAPGQMMVPEGYVCRYDPTTLQETQRYDTDGDNIGDIKISADMTRLIACSSERFFDINLATGAVLKNERIGFLHRTDVKSAVTRDLSHIYVNGHYLILFGKDGDGLGSSDLPGNTHGVTISPDDKMIAIPFGGSWGNDNETLKRGDFNGVWIFDRQGFDAASVAASALAGVSHVAALGAERAVVAGDHKVSVWDFKENKAIQQIEGPMIVRNMAVSADGKLVACAEDRSISLFDLTIGKRTQNFSGHTGAVTGMVFSRAGDMLYSAAEDGHVIAWDVATGQIKFNDDEGHPARGLVISRGVELLTATDGQLIHIAMADGKATSEPLAAKTADGDLPLRSVHNSLSGTQILMEFTNPKGPGVLGFYDMQRNALAPRFAPTGQYANLTVTGMADGRIIGLEKDIFDVVPSPDGTSKYVLQYGRLTRVPLTAAIGHAHLTDDHKYDLTWTHVASLSNSITGQPVQRFVPPFDPASPPDISAPLRAAAVSPDHARVATAGRDKVIRIWNAGTGEVLKTIESPVNFVQDLVFTPDGKTLAVVAGLEQTPPVPGTAGQPAPGPQPPHGAFPVYFLNIETGSAAAVTPVDFGSSVSFSKSGKYMLIDPAPYAIGSARIRVWDITAKKEAGATPGIYLSNLPAQFSNDNILVSGQGDACRLINPGGSPLWTVSRDKMPSLHAVVSGDGLWALVDCNDKTTWLLDLKTGKQIEHWSRATADIFMPDGKAVVVQGNQTLIVYDCNKHTVVQTAEFRSLQPLKPFVAPDNSLALIGEDIIIPVPAASVNAPAAGGTP